MILADAIEKAKGLQDKVGNLHDGKSINYVIPAPLDGILFSTYIGDFYSLYSEAERKELNLNKFYSPIQDVQFGVFYILEGTEHEIANKQTPFWKILVRR